MKTVAKIVGKIVSYVIIGVASVFGFGCVLGFLDELGVKKAGKLFDKIMMTCGYTIEVMSNGKKKYYTVV